MKYITFDGKTYYRLPPKVIFNTKDKNIYIKLLDYDNNLIKSFSFEADNTPDFFNDLKNEWVLFLGGGPLWKGCDGVFNVFSVLDRIGPKHYEPRYVLNPDYKEKIK